MSCFWDALIRELSDEEAARAGVKGVTSPSEFANRLQKHPRTFVMTRWQGRHLSERQRAENAAAISRYDTTTTADGYGCGSTDPFLLLLSHLAGVHIRHKTPYGTFEYTSLYPKARWLVLESTSNHMQ